MTNFLYFFNVPGTNYTFMLAMASEFIPVGIAIFTMH
jgi:hypothetical protein